MQLGAPGHAEVLGTGPMQQRNAIVDLDRAPTVAVDVEEQVSSRNPLTELAEQWRDEHAPLLRSYGDERGAQICEYHAGQLEEALHERESQPLSVAEASALSGFSQSHLYHCIEDGTLPNAGRRGAPRIRRADVPKKLGTRSQGLIPLERAAILADLDNT